jgi:two-component system response regulator HydG
MTPDTPSAPKNPGSGQGHRPEILVVDDKPNMVKLLERIFESDYAVTGTTSAQEALGLMAARAFALVIMDIKMPEMSGMDLLAQCKRLRPEVEIILITAYGEVAQAVAAMKAGAYDYIQKPFEPEEIRIAVEKALEHRRLVDRTQFLERAVEEKFGLQNIVGDSAPMRELDLLIEKAAETDVTVLIQGESGTGKELVAKAIHYTGRRAKGKFVPINCAAIPKGLLESELFGHVKGAFSGAVTSKTGLFEEAERGTLFLDEISELDLELQVKVTRAIQEREIRAIGDTKDRAVDVRIIAATNTDLQSAVDAGRFRPDLYYRLHVFPISISPLRERMEDLPLLVTHFVEKYNKLERKNVEGVEPDALSALAGYSWPGNVRELENAIERAVLLAEKGRIGRQLFMDILSTKRMGAAVYRPRTDLPYRDAIEIVANAATEEYLRGILRKHEGNVTRAAAEAGVERESLHRLLKRFGIRSEDFKKT